MGRHKIDIKKIPETQLRQVCFSKRRKGLFKKAADICTASGCSIAIIIFSPAGNLFTFAHPSVDGVCGRFLGNEVPIDSNKIIHEAISDDAYSYQEESDGGVSDTESDHGDKEEVMRKDNNIEEKVGQEKEEKETKEQALAIIPKGDQFWWNKPIDHLGVEELQQLEKSIILLRDKVRDRANFLLAERPLSLCSFHYK